MSVESSGGREPETLRGLFEALVDLAPEAREARLRALGLAPAQEARLRAMLDADGGSPALLRVPVADAIDRLRDDRSLVEGLAGTRVGGFRLLQPVGEGGSSIVFLAEREVGDGTQRVALKLLRFGLYSAEAQRRFRREQAILAQLTHPHIARLIEGGVSDAGIPYIAMEYVDGQPITRYADARALSLEERLRLYVVLCRTVESAHASLVVHRDLKPSNVLVDREGGLKVLDFGIAKVLADDELATHTQSIALTPEYAAPEQRLPGVVTTAVDVYALGVLLGELVTGRRPDAAGFARSLALVDAGAQVPAGLPPRALLQRRLRGDLQAIVATALAEEPARRYRSAGALADDIERHLAGQAVRAHAPSGWYRARKFVARHRGGVVVSLLFVLGILVSLSLALWQARVARHEAAVARAEAARADSMRDFMFEAFMETGPAGPRAGPVTVAMAVERALAAIGVDRGADPRARIELQVRLGEVLMAQGELERAAQQLEAAGVAAWAEFGADDPLALDAELSALANEYRRGHWAEVRARADRLQARIPASEPLLRARLLRRSAMVATRLREPQRGLADAREAVALARASGDADELHSALEVQASVLQNFGSVRDAIAAYEELLANDRGRYGEVHAQVAQTLASQARAYLRLGETEEAERLARAALAIDDQVYPPDHWHRSLHLNALGLALYERRAYAEAIDVFAQALRIDRLTFEPDSPDLLSNLGSLGMSHLQREDFDAALPILREGYELQLARGGEDAAQTNRMRLNYGYALAQSGQRQAGEALLEHALASAQARAEPDADILPKILDRLARVALDAGDPAAALPRVRRLRELASALPMSGPHWHGRVDAIEAELELALGRPAAARVLLDAAAAAIAAAPRADAVLRAEIPLLQAAAAQALGDRALALRLADSGRKALAGLPSPPRRLLDLAASLPAQPRAAAAVEGFSTR